SWGSGGWSGSGEAVDAVLEEADELFPVVEVSGIIHEFATISRPLELNFDDFPDAGGGAVAHEDNTVREVDRLIDVVGDHHRGESFAIPEIDKDLLELELGEFVEHSERLVEEQHLG